MNRKTTIKVLRDAIRKLQDPDLFHESDFTERDIFNSPGYVSKAEMFVINKLSFTNYD